jgi:ribonuclease-3
VPQRKGSSRAGKPAAASVTTRPRPLPADRAGADRGGADRGRSDRGSDVEREAARLDAAEHIVGYTFSSRSTLLRALTHSSLLNERASVVAHNEILEFKGDAVLSLVCVELLCADTPEAPEGELTARRAAWVSEPSLSQACTQSGLVKLLRTSRGFASGELPASLRADLVEAVLGAVYDDGGLPAARAVALRLLGRPPASAPVLSQAAKKVLQERLQGLFGSTPVYEVAQAGGAANAPVFSARCVFRDTLLGEGQGGTKRAATEHAAQVALAQLPADDAALRARFAS